MKISELKHTITLLKHNCEMPADGSLHITKFVPITKVRASVMPVHDVKKSKTFSITTRKDILRNQEKVSAIEWDGNILAVMKNQANRDDIRFLNFIVDEEH